MPAPPAVPETTLATSAPAPASPAAPEPSLYRRIRRVFPYIAHVKQLWVVVLVATIVGAATEPAMPALMKPLLDTGFNRETFNPWLVPAALLLLFGRDPRG